MSVKYRKFSSSIFLEYLNNSVFGIYARLGPIAFFWFFCIYFASIFFGMNEWYDIIKYYYVGSMAALGICCLAAVIQTVCVGKWGIKLGDCGICGELRRYLYKHERAVLEFRSLLASASIWRTANFFLFPILMALVALVAIFWLPMWFFLNAETIDIPQDRLFGVADLAFWFWTFVVLTQIIVFQILVFYRKVK